MAFSFFLSLLILAYTYVGYPLLVGVMARLFPRRANGTELHTLPMVSALIPVYNGEAFIREKLDSLLTLDYPADRLEILFCSDCSEDGTNVLLDACAREYPDQVRVFFMQARSGKPAILNRLRREARGQVLLMTDIRQPLEKRCLRYLVEGLADPQVGIAGGQLCLRGETGAGLYWKYENYIRQSESAYRGVTGVSGSLYVIAAADMQDLPKDIILDDVWVPSLQWLQGQEVILVPEAIAWDRAMEDNREFVRKVRTLAGNYQLLRRLPALLLPWKNPVWFEFFSHKFMRLVCPWALLVLFGSSFFLWLQGGGADRMAGIFLIAQIAFYLFALLGERGGRMGKLARTFVLLNVAALVGLWRFLRGSQKIAW
ncbi:glycosyltransferase [Thiolapillus sp.]